jgi:hypothetical protein
MTSLRGNNLCGACKGIDFDALGDFYGYAHYPKVEFLRLEAQRENGCRLCAFLWWSLRHDHHSIDVDLTVRLYSNPPPSLCSEQLQQLDVVVASAEKLASFGWARGRIGQPWQVSPSDYLLRGHLTLYGIYGASFSPSQCGFDGSDGVQGTRRTNFSSTNSSASTQIQTIAFILFSAGFRNA